VTLFWRKISLSSSSLNHPNIFLLKILGSSCTHNCSTYISSHVLRKSLICQGFSDPYNSQRKSGHSSRSEGTRPHSGILYRYRRWFSSVTSFSPVIESFSVAASLSAVGGKFVCQRSCTHLSVSYAMFWVSGHILCICSVLCHIGRPMVYRILTAVKINRSSLPSFLYLCDGVFNFLHPAHKLYGFAAGSQIRIIYGLVWAKLRELHDRAFGRTSLSICSFVSLLASPGRSAVLLS
jgi:hypothetical protein